jgi:hypothetical protein
MSKEGAAPEEPGDVGERDANEGVSGANTSVFSGSPSTW